MFIKFKEGDKVRFSSEINGTIWEVLTCINSDEFLNASLEEKITLKVIPKYRCQSMDEGGKIVTNNITENLIEKLN